MDVRDASAPRASKTRPVCAAATAAGPSRIHTASRSALTRTSTAARPARRSTSPTPTTTASRSSRRPARGSPTSACTGQRHRPARSRNCGASLSTRGQRLGRGSLGLPRRGVHPLSRPVHLRRRRFPNPVVPPGNTSTSVFNQVRGMSFDAAGDVVAMDSVNQRVDVFDPSRSALSICAASVDSPAPATSTGRAASPSTRPPATTGSPTPSRATFRSCSRSALRHCRAAHATGRRYGDARHRARRRQLPVLHRDRRRLRVDRRHQEQPRRVVERRAPRRLSMSAFGDHRAAARSVQRHPTSVERRPVDRQPLRRRQPEQPRRRA